MCINPKWLKDFFIHFCTLGGRNLDFVTVKKYLGSFISDDLCDDKDTK